MKRSVRLFLILIALLSFVLGALWLSLPPTTLTASPKFSVGPRRITPVTTPSFGIGQNFAALVAPDGTLWAWGNLTDDGSPGGAVHLGPRPEQISPEKNWKQVAAGWFGLLALKHDGSLWALGSNSEGLLGIDSISGSIPNLTRVGTNSDWAIIKTGLSHAMALKNDGSLWCWGQNNYGQVGVGFLSRRESITRIGLHTNWIAISPGAFQSYALRRDGTIWTWGLDLTSSRKNSFPVQVGVETNWASISAGDYHLIGTDTSGSNWLIGPNAHILQRGATRTNWAPLPTPNWIEVHSGQDSILARQASGQWSAEGVPWTWQFPRDFQPLAIHLQGQTSLFLMPDGRLWTVGRKIPGTPRTTVLTQLRDVIRQILKQSVTTPPQSEHKEPFLLWEQP